MDPEVAMWIAVGAASVAGSGFLAAIVLGPLGRAVGSRLSGRRGSLQDADELRQRLLAVEVALDRVAELEERLDFTERVLARPDPE
ncbi:MAG: hypothetical protein E4G90_09735 [Gemmatimonadales bacterium]|nr:MAG: hypothetical protein E4G90_09735 [Gemmatimonadales bacterium]